MNSDSVIIESKLYISSKRASKKYGYTMDYLGQLARGGKILSKMFGRNRFFEVDSVDKYIESLNAVERTTVPIISLSNMDISDSRDAVGAVVEEQIRPELVVQNSIINEENSTQTDLVTDTKNYSLDDGSSIKIDGDETTKISDVFHQNQQVNNIRVREIISVSDLVSPVSKIKVVENFPDQFTANHNLLTPKFAAGSSFAVSHGIDNNFGKLLNYIFVGLIALSIIFAIGFIGLKKSYTYHAGSIVANQFASPISTYSYDEIKTFLNHLDSKLFAVLNIGEQIIIGKVKDLKNYISGHIADEVKIVKVPTINLPNNSLSVTNSSTTINNQVQLSEDEIKALISEVIEEKGVVTVESLSNNTLHQGVVTFPSTGSLSDDDKIKEQVKNSFSDEVNVTLDASRTTGVVTPVFKNSIRTSDYIFVLVPVKE